LRRYVVISAIAGAVSPVSGWPGPAVGSLLWSCTCTTSPAIRLVLVELDFEDRVEFGYVRLGAHPEGAEWGYVDLVELAELFVAGHVTAIEGGLRTQPPAIVERDLHCRPRPAGEVIPDL
jgi:hypothetical protein